MFYKGIEFKKSNPEQSVLDALSDNQLHEFEVTIDTLGINEAILFSSDMASKGIESFGDVHKRYQNSYGRINGDLIVTVIDKLAEYQRSRESVWRHMFGCSNNVPDFIDLFSKSKERMLDNLKMAQQRCLELNCKIIDGYIYRVLIEKRIGCTGLTRAICEDDALREFIDFSNTTEDSLFSYLDDIIAVYNLVVHEGKKLEDLYSDHPILFKLYEIEKKLHTLKFGVPF